MRNISKHCFICGTDTNDYYPAEDYLKCPGCGHEIIAKEKQQPYIINDVLSLKKLGRKDLLSEYKQKILNRTIISKKLLLDIGSGSGQFLYFNRYAFERCIGIEITKECIDFTRNILGLEVEQNVDQLGAQVISVATFWHSLEHIPVPEISKILSFINKNADEGTRIIISVPNSSSLQYRLFGTGYAYYDPMAHIHQFTMGSLILMMKNYGFEKEREFSSPAYYYFGYLQGILNKLNRIHNYLYYRKKRGVNYQLGCLKARLLDLYNFILVIIFIPAIVVLGSLDIIYPRKGVVITVCFRKRRK